jgi:hypothetical protein
MFNDLTPETRRLLTDPTTVASAATVGLLPVRVMSYNTDRRLAIISNDSINDIYLGFGPSVLANTGIRLNANGGTFEFGLFTTFPWLGEVWAVAAFANNTIGIVEV